MMLAIKCKPKESSGKGLEKEEQEIGRTSERRLQAKEDWILVAASFEPVQRGLWGRSGILFGRGAALQHALRELSENGEHTLFD